MMGRRRALMGSDGGGGVTMKGAASDLKRDDKYVSTRRFRWNLRDEE